MIRSTRLLVTGVLLFSLLTALVGPVAALPREPEEIRSLRDEISLLNLLRGLYLSKPQVERLHGLAMQAAKDRESVSTRLLASKDDLQASLTKLRNALFDPPGFEVEVQNQANTLNHRMKEAVGELKDRLAAMEDKAEGILTSSQRAIVEGFKPCLIPPRDLRNPVRVGQAGGQAGLFGKVADLVRGAPDDIWKASGPSIVKRLAALMESESGAMTPAMKGDMEKRLHQVAANIRSLDDIDYAVQRDDLAAQLQLINPHEALKQGHRKTGKIAQFLLSDAAARIYPRWLKAMDRITAAGTPAPVARHRGPKPAQTMELSAKAINLVRRAYRQRRHDADLPPFPQFIEPMKQAGLAGDKTALLEGLLACLRQLAAVRTDADLVGMTSRIAHIVAKNTGLMLLHKQHDPFGFHARLVKAQQAANPPEDFRTLLGLIDTFSRFRPAPGQ